MKFRSLLAVALVATLSLSAFAAKDSIVIKKMKKKTPTTKVVKKSSTAKNNKKTPAAAVIKPVAGTEFSYAAGVAQSASLAQYVAQRAGVDSAHIQDFVAGLNTTVSAEDESRMRALLAAIDIKKQLPQIVQSMNQQATGKADTTYVVADEFVKGLTEGLLKKSTLTADSATKIEQRQYDFHNNQVKTLNADYLAQYKKQKGVKSTASGLLYKVIKQGDGAMPADTSQVEVHYEGRLVDGTVFDSSYKRGETATFGLNQVIKGWSEAVKLMKVGSEYEICLPYNLAYGERGTRGIPPFATLIFKIELKSIK